VGTARPESYSTIWWSSSLASPGTTSELERAERGRASAAWQDGHARRPGWMPGEQSERTDSDESQTHTAERQSQVTAAAKNLHGRGLAVGPRRAHRSSQARPCARAALLGKSHAAHPERRRRRVVSLAPRGPRESPRGPRAPLRASPRIRANVPEFLAPPSVFPALHTCATAPFLRRLAPSFPPQRPLNQLRTEPHAVRTAFVATRRRAAQGSVSTSFSVDPSCRPMKR